MRKMKQLLFTLLFFVFIIPIMAQNNSEIPMQVEVQIGWDKGHYSNLFKEYEREYIQYEYVGINDSVLHLNRIYSEIVKIKADHQYEVSNGASVVVKIKRKWNDMGFSIGVGTQLGDIKYKRRIDFYSDSINGPRFFEQKYHSAHLIIPLEFNKSIKNIDLSIGINNSFLLTSSLKKSYKKDTSSNDFSLYQLSALASINYNFPKNWTIGLQYEHGFQSVFVNAEHGKRRAFGLRIGKSFDFKTASDE